MIQLPKGFKLRAGAELHGPLPRAVETIAKYLDAIKYEEIINTFQLGQSVNLSMSVIHHYAAHPHLAAYRLKTNNSVVLWGSKRTITELKKRLEKQ